MDRPHWSECLCGSFQLHWPSEEIRETPKAGAVSSGSEQKGFGAPALPQNDATQAANIDAELGKVENAFREMLRLKKMSERDRGDFRNQMTVLLDKLANLYEEIKEAGE